MIPEHQDPRSVIGPARGASLTFMTSLTSASPASLLPFRRDNRKVADGISP